MYVLPHRCRLGAPAAVRGKHAHALVGPFGWTMSPVTSDGRLVEVTTRGGADVVVIYHPATDQEVLERRRGQRDTRATAWHVRTVPVAHRLQVQFVDFHVSFYAMKIDSNFLFNNKLFCVRFLWFSVFNTTTYFNWQNVSTKMILCWYVCISILIVHITQC